MSDCLFKLSGSPYPRGEAGTLRGDNRGEGGMTEDTIHVFEDWGRMVNLYEEAVSAGEWDLFQECIHSGAMAILVDGLPRLIEGTIH
jgi:hypothetical protein